MLSASRFVSPLLLLATTAALACDGQPPAQSSATAAQPSSAPADPVAPRSDAAAAEKHYQSALALEAAGRYPEARAEVDLAIAAGSGRDATLLAAKLAILRDDLDAARRLLEPLGTTETDALVLYNLGLIAQRTGQYNEARTRYLAALKADPNYAAIRYNLAVLAWDAGVKDEAQHHARKFLELSPGDPNAPELLRKVELDGSGAPAPTPAPAPEPGKPGDLKTPAGR